MLRNMSRRNSEYKRSSTHQAGLTERLLGHDAKERITSTLKALGIYKGDGGQSSSSGSHAKSTSLDLPLWDLPKSTGNKEDRHSSSWTAPEGNPTLDDRGPHPREHRSDYGALHRDDSHRVHPEHSTIQERSLYDPTDQFHIKPDDTSFGLPYHENNAGNIVPYGQEQQQQQWNESSYPQNETGLLSQEGNFSSTGGSDTNANNAWNAHPFNNPPSSYAPSGAQDPATPSFGPPWQQGGSNPPPLFNGPYNSAAVHPSGDAIKGTNLIGNSNTPDQPRQPRGLFDAVKKTSYVNPSRPNLKPLVEVTISNPAALTLPKGDVVPNRDATKLTGEGKGARKEHGGSGTKRSHEKSHPGGHERPSKEAKLLPDIKKRRPLVVPGENELKHYENDPERLPLIRKIMKGSPSHQMETLQLAGIQDALRGKNILDWKCYVCRKMTGSWQNYVSHCTSKYHRSLVHKLRTNSKVREIMRQQLLDLPSAEMWAAMRETSSSLDIPEEEETNKGGVIHPCNSCGRFYSKADGLQRHFESEEHRQRVLFLKERFGESWQQFRWYNQATESQNLNLEEPVGVAFVMPLSGFFCKLCSQFYNSEVSAKDVHCRQSSHIKKVKEWDRTSKGSMISLSLDANEIAAAVKKNDGASSPPRSSKSSSQRRSPSSSRQGSHSSRDRQGKGSLERSSSSQREIKDIAKSRSGGIKIPGLDLDESNDLSDVSDDEESSIKSETRSTSRHPKSNVSEKSEDNIPKGDSKLEEGELSASEVRQLEKNQETERIVKEWETREKQRHWDREQRDLTKQREEDRQKEQSKRDRERKERREREDRERKEREERERQRKEKEKRGAEKREREKLEKERQDKEERDRKEKIQREKAEKERKDKERKEREKREKEEKERKEKEKIEQLEREKAHLEQEKQIQEERKRLQEAKEQLEKTRQLQEQRENDFQANQMRERAMLEKRIWEQQMRERELMEQQLRQQQLLEQQEFEKSKMMQQMSGERMTNHERLEQERKERELHDQQTRERELREAELREHQEAEYQRLQREQLKEQEMRHMEMLKNVRRESDVRDAEQKRLDEQAGELREQELRTERLHQVNLQEQEERDRSIREEGYLEWQRREQNMRAGGVPEREIALSREMFEREVEATVVKDAERRAQQLGEVLHNPQREGDLREQVIQQQQMRERRDGLVQELRENARWELERKETDLRREGFSDREIEEIMSHERQIYEDKILEELRVRGWAEAVDDIDRRDTDAHNETRERSRGRTPDEQEGSSKRERDWSDEDEPREMATDRRQESYQPQDEEDFERHRSEEEDEFERHRDEEEEFAMRRRREEEDLLPRQQEESRAMRNEDRDIVIHEMGGMRNVQIVGKGRLPPGDLREELRERERDDRSRSSSVRRRTRGDDRGRVGKRPERRPGNRRGRGKGWRGRSRRGR